MKHKLLLLFVVIVFLCTCSHKAAAQKNLFLVDGKRGNFYEIKTGSSQKMRIAGIKRMKKVRIIEVRDSGVVLRGNFARGSGYNEEQYFPLNDLIAIKKISVSHSIFRGVSAAAVVPMVGVGIAETIEHEGTSFLYFEIAAIYAIPWYIGRRTLYLQDRWRLEIK